MNVVSNNAPLNQYEHEICVIQRKMQRSQRQSNPDNYEPDFLGKKGRKTVVKKGQPKKGRRKWNKSKHYQKLATSKRELERRKSEYCKSQNRRLVNDILRNGNQIKTEKVSVKGWQKNWGKAISAKSPGFFQSELKRSRCKGWWFVLSVFDFKNSAISNSSDRCSYQKNSVRASSGMTSPV